MRTKLTSLLAAGLCMAATAATYKVELDRPGGIYTCGEQATFTVRLLSTNRLSAVRSPSAKLYDWCSFNAPLEERDLTKLPESNDCSLESEALRLFYVKTNERRGGFVEDIRMENVKAKKVRYGVMSVETDVLYRIENAVNVKVSK